MDDFYLQILVGSKQIDLKGKLHERYACYANFLKVFQRPRKSTFSKLALKIGYQGSELEQSILFAFFIICASLYNIFFASVQKQYEIAIIVIITYSLIANTVINAKCEIVAHLIGFATSLTLLIFSFKINYIDSSVLLASTISAAIILVSKISIYFQNYVNNQTPNFPIKFQSNLLSSLFIFWRCYQIAIIGLDESLFSTNIVLALILSMKVFGLQDYNILSIVQILIQKNNKRHVEQSDNAMQMSQTLTLQIQKKQQASNSSQINFNQPFDLGKEQEKNDQIIEVYQQQQKDLQVAQDQRQSKKKILSTASILIVFTGIIIYMMIKRKQEGTEQICKFFFYYFCLIVLCLYVSQIQKNIKSYQKNMFIYLIIFLNDLFLISASAFLVYIKEDIGLSIQQSIIYAIIPFVTILQFNNANDQVHDELDNGKYLGFIFFFLVPLTLRSIILYENLTIGLYLIDGFIGLHLLFIIVIWSNKGFFTNISKQLKLALGAKKKKMKIFDKLKLMTIDYIKTIRYYVYIHISFLLILYNFTDIQIQNRRIIYFILYFSPMFLYFLGLINTYLYQKEYPKTYSPYIINVLIIIGLIAYSILGYVDSIGSDQDLYSVMILLNITLFVVLMEGEKVAIINLPNYFCFIRFLIISVFFILIYYPFGTIFISGYYLTNFSNNYFYYFGMVGFFYIWIIITAVGTSIHLVLNLTQKSKKDLFISHYMQNQLRKIGMKDDVQKILMISNTYQMLNQRSEDLLKYLKTQKNVLVAIRKQKDIPYDYELIQPQDQIADNKIQMKSKPVNPLDIINQIKNAENNEVQPLQKENPVLTYFREKEKNKIQIIKPMDQNKNIFQVKRLAQNKTIPLDLKQLQKSRQFREMKREDNVIFAQYLSKLYTFLSQPSPCLSVQMFTAFLRLLSKQKITNEEGSKIYSKFGQSSFINENKFKNFIVDFVEFKYEMKQEPIESLYRTFCCYQLLPLLMNNQSQLEYYLKRKKITISQESKDIWLSSSQNDENMQIFRELLSKQLKKKEKILYQFYQEKKKSQKTIQDIQIQSDSNDNQSVSPSVQKSFYNSIKSAKKQLKDKKFLKPENIYTIIVNSLGQCYLFYEKESQNFKITSIKLSVSNILAIITKIIDFVFVFGYSTVYLLFAYFYEDYSQASYALSNIPYTILISLAGFFIFLYTVLIFYHKKDFEMGTLGLDEDHKTLSLLDFKFYTIQLLFLLGSALANYILSIGLNSFICNNQTHSLYNFSDNECYTKLQYVYSFIALLILVIYWPLSAITFPFSTAMDRSLEIKYKSQFQILYLQFKFLMNGFNTLLIPFDFQTQQLIVSIMKVVICLILAILYLKLQPCSYELMNKIQGKIYILLTILSFAGALCYFVGFLYSVIITGAFIVLYLIYFIYITIKSYNQLKNENVEDDLVEDNIKNQNIQIKIIKQFQKQEIKQLSKKDKTQEKTTKKPPKTQHEEGSSQLKLRSQNKTANLSEDVNKSSKPITKKSLFW